jgi:glycosyltransferase involved in cell wall biosynthesis
MRKCLVIIPAYNAAKTLGQLTSQVKRLHQNFDVLIVDDGSADESGKIARTAGAILMTHDRNRGKGDALKTGFAYAVAHDYDAVITLDADLQHDPAEIQCFLNAYSDDRTILVGIRRRDKRCPLHASCPSLTSLYRFSARSPPRQPIWLSPDTDGNSEEHHLSSSADWAVASQAASGIYQIVEISTIYHPGRSSINPPIDTIRFLIMLTKSLFW